MKIWQKKQNAMLPQEQQEFFEIISIYAASGLSLEEGIQDFRDGFPKDSYNYRLCNQLIKGMSNGQSFGEAIKKYPKSFSPFTSGIIAMAEGTGHFEASLAEISFRQSMQTEITSKIKSATLVPKVSAVIGLLAFLFATNFAIPKMAENIKTMDAQLPLITQLVLMLGEFMTSFWWLIALLVIAGMFFYKWLKENKPDVIAKSLLKLPFWRPITISRTNYDFCTIMGICLESGVEPVQALTYTAMASDNLFMKRLIGRALKHIKSKGTNYDEALQKEDIIPLLDVKVYRMLKSGRKTGRTGEIAKQLAEYYRKKLLVATNQIGDKVGMMVITPIYVMIAILMTAVVLPITGIASNAAMHAF